MPVIYKILFSTGEFYIGQTSCFEKRKAQHLQTKGLGSPKLMQAFKNEIPIFEVLEETTEEAVDALEIKYIEQLNPSLNTLAGGKSMRGLNHPRSKYTKKQVEDVVSLFLNTSIKYSVISESTGVGKAMVFDICKRRAHLWATQHITEEQYNNALNTRKSTHQVYSPDNVLFEANTVSELATITGLSTPTLDTLFKAKKGISHTGWSTEIKPTLTIKDPLGNIHSLPINRMKELLNSFDLSTYQITRLIKGKPSADWYPIREHTFNVKK